MFNFVEKRKKRRSDERTSQVELIQRFLIIVADDFIGFGHVDEHLRIDQTDCFDQSVNLIGVDRHEQQTARRMREAPFAPQLGDAVTAVMEHRIADFFRLLRDDKQGIQLVAQMHRLYD
ncbi:hypothetical protein HOLDEFILI_03522, partial [Holdemania filiformis DSM 12042]